jgi:hypothetical protein
MHELLLDTALAISIGGLLLVIILATDYLFRRRRKKPGSRYAARS